MAERVEILYLAWNRLDYTGTSWHHLMASTEWQLVEKLTVYDDGSDDGTQEFLRERVAEFDRCDVEMRVTNLRSPVAVMNHFLAEQRAPLFAKIDNDIAVPPGWLRKMINVLERHPDVELLGMEAGRTKLVEGELKPRRYGVDPADGENSHIGGVGLMRTSAFTSRPPLPVRGRFGFTEWQWRYQPNRAWIEPDLMVPQLDRVPVEPYVDWRETYIEAGWQREWPLMERPWCDPYWEWILDAVEEAPE
jgi:hypothetical protein